MSLVPGVFRNPDSTAVIWFNATRIYAAHHVKKMTRIRTLFQRRTIFGRFRGDVASKAC
jgi:hypothetical protein